MRIQVVGMLGAAYLIGSVPTGYWLGAWWKGIDIRRHGSGNLGATNVFRVLGKGPGILTLAIDILKGLLPVLWCQHRFPSDPALAAGTGLAAIAGHAASLFLRFRGGKGVATSAGVFAALVPVPFMASVGVFLLSLLATRFVSLSSILAVLALAAASFAWPHTPWQTGPAVAAAVFVVWKHRENIQRLRRGAEPRAWGKKAA